tara:strand:+ start:321 stop:1415 length:1095 start_codon:yes stop_codon:yes gene_type:complete
MGDNMGISDRTHFWTSRTAGSDPASAVGANNTAWTLSGTGSDGSVVGSAWRISSTGSGQTWSVSSAAATTLVAGFQYQTTPTDGTVLMALDNGSKRVEVQSNGGNANLKLVGATTATTHDLDLKAALDDGVPILLRLTLDASGNARLYMREIIEDDLGETHYLSVVGKSSTSSGIFWGNANGSVDWFTVLATTHGAYSPDEMDMTDFVSTSFVRTALNIVEILRNSKRFYLSTHVGDEGILYGFDLSSGMMSRLRPPTVHVMLQNTTSPDFLALSGSRTEQNYTAVIMVTTRGTDYRNAYRMGLSITGEVFDELYTNTGLEGGIDTLTDYRVNFDTKMDDDEIVCVHILTLTYMKKVNMLRREL